MLIKPSLIVGGSTVDSTQAPLDFQLRLCIDKSARINVYGGDILKSLFYIISYVHEINRR